MKHLKCKTVWLVCLMLLGMMTIPAAATPATPALPEVKDPSFEIWGGTGESENWMIYKDGAAVGNALPATEEKHSGKYSLKLTDIAEDGTCSAEANRIISYQNLGLIPENSAFEISVWINIPRFDSEEGGVRIIARHGSMFGSPYVGPYPASGGLRETDGWEKWTIRQEKSTATTDLYLDIECMTGSYGYEIYIDDIEIRELKPQIKNGDFENGMTDWGIQGTASVYVDSAKGSNVGFVESGYIIQTVQGLKPNGKYRLSFDVFTEQGKDPGLVNIQGPEVSGNYASMTGIRTDGVWERRSVEWTMASIGTTIYVLMRYNTYASAGTKLYYDNIALEEIDENEMLSSNGSFELGTKGLQDWSTSASVQQSEDAINGQKAILIENTSGDASLNYGKLMAFPTHTAKLYYELSAFVKVKETTNATIILTVYQHTEETANYAETHHLQVDAATLPKNEWCRISKLIPVANNVQSCSIMLRLRNEGEVLLDNISYYKTEKMAVFLQKANGAYTESLVNGSSIKVNMPVKEKATAIFAIYKQEQGNKTLCDVRIAELTDLHVANGYAEFTMGSEEFPDFETAQYYAKFMLLNNESLKPLENVSVYIK